MEININNIISSEYDNRSEIRTKSLFDHLIKLDCADYYNESFDNAWELFNEKGYSSLKQSIKKIFDEYYNYRNFNNIIEKLGNVIGDKFDYSFNNDELIITCVSKNINNALTIKNSIEFRNYIRNIKNYSLNMNVINNMILIFTSDEESDINKVEYKFDIKKMTGWRNIYFSNGNSPLIDNKGFDLRFLNF